MQSGEFEATLSNFSCKDKDVEHFLKTKALDNENRHKSCTYIFLETYKNDDKLAILGYFTLSLKILEFGKTVSKSTIKEIDDFSKNTKAVPTLLIGQFGKDENKAGNLSGDYLMERCLDKIRQARNIIDGRIALIECLPIKLVIEFYERNGFEYLQTDENDKFHQMFLML